MSQLKFLTAYPITLQNQVQQLIADNTLGDYLTRRYPQRHDIQTDKMLYQYTMLLKHNTSDRFKKDLQEISSLIENVISTKHT